MTIQFQYHDGWVETVQIGPRRELTLLVGLDTAWNPGQEGVRIRFGGIQNMETVEAFACRVTEMISERDGGPRIDALHLDEKVPSKPGDLHVHLQIEYIGHIRIHCQSISEQPAG